ncbi:MAG TPA: right-handed parallel beta-helix repeat-containing protein, partial [Tichowtungia sp.]|nr:right-handed parallel beta-helix repeat-containing protein [Tichowtungia sp.]
MKTLSGRNVISFISPIQGLCFLCLFAPVRRAAAVPASSEPIIVQQSSSQVIHVPAEDNDRLDAAESVHETHYVDAYNTTPVFPYTDWFTAATNIQDAVDAATFTDTVFVADGVYNLTSGIVVDKQITLRSVNGPDVTIVDGGGSTGCFNLGSNACLLSGFTIRHGKVNSYGGAWNGSGGGVYCLDTASVVSNCIIRDNFSFLSGSGMYGGTAYNCTFSSNSVDTGNGSGMANGVAYNCIFSDNTRGGISGSTAVNCMISDNSGSRRGCGIYGGTAINCIISGNSTPIEGGGIYHGTAYHCVFTGNEAHAAGGGMFEATAINCIFIGNRADSGGGMYNSTAINCTIIGNEADLNGGGLVGGTATNCIIYYNQAGGTGNDTYSVSPRFSCASDLPHGSYGNITNAPLFADRFDKNFRLTDQSP